MNGKPLDAIFVCVGGGGLLAGVASCIKALRPEVKVIGVEADDAAGISNYIQSNICMYILKTLFHCRDDGVAGCR